MSLQQFSSWSTVRNFKRFAEEVLPADDLKKFVEEFLKEKEERDQNFVDFNMQQLANFIDSEPGKKFFN